MGKSPQSQADSNKKPSQRNALLRYEKLNTKKKVPHVSWLLVSEKMAAYFTDFHAGSDFVSSMKNFRVKIFVKKNKKLMLNAHCDLDQKQK